MKREDVTPEILRELLHYEPETGSFIWKRRDRKWFKSDRSFGWWNKRYAGKVTADRPNKYGYKVVTLLDFKFHASRVAYAHHHGHWPEHSIDHVNGVTTDDRISNLRDVDNLTNQQNLPISKLNKSGVMGVFWHKSNKKWRATIRVNKKQINLGAYDDFDEAVSVRREAERKYGFHPNHGRPTPSKGGV